MRVKLFCAIFRELPETAKKVRQPARTMPGPHRMNRQTQSGFVMPSLISHEKIAFILPQLASIYRRKETFLIYRHSDDETTCACLPPFRCE